MSEKLTERTELLLTKKMVKSIVRIKKRYKVSKGEVLRMGLASLEQNEQEKK